MSKKLKTNFSTNSQLTAEYDETKQTLTLANDKNGIEIPVSGGSGAGVSSLNSKSGVITLSGSNYIDVITSNQDIRIELNSMPDLTSYHWAYDVDFFVNGSFDISAMADQDWEELQAVAVNSTQRGHAALFSFNYDGEGSKYGVLVSSDFNSSGYWVEFITKNPANNALYLVKFEYGQNGQNKTGTSSIVDTSPVGFTLATLPTYGNQGNILKSLTTRNDGTTVRKGDLIFDGFNKIAIIQSEASSTQWVVRTITDGNQGGGTSTTYTNTDGTLTIDNSNYTINSVSQQTKINVSDNFSGNINANYYFSLFDNDSENYIYYDKWTKNLSVNLNVYPSFKATTIGNWELAKIISLHMPNLKLKLGTYSISGFYHDNLDNTQNKALNGLCFITLDSENTGTLLNLAITDTANFPPNTGEKFIINFNFQIKKEVDN